LIGKLSIRVLTEGVHSGLATGIAPTPVRIAIELLTRLENPRTGDLLLDELRTEVPKDRLAQIDVAAKALGAAVVGKVPFAEGVRPVSADLAELIRNNTWSATLAVTGADGLPPVVSAGNVLLPEIALKLSLRLPPNCDAKRACQAVRRTLETDPPYGAQVRFESANPMTGWNAPPFAPWLEESMNDASKLVFGREALHTGVGGTIPFMGMLGERFPKTQFFITGLLGPQSNAHGPNEFLHLEYAKKLTRCVALVLADHARQIRHRSAMSRYGSVAH
jgi:acetylornithine deacetylase/succinyl-diaminopimelate desuccinylase-like protein